MDSWRRAYEELAGWPGVTGRTIKTLYFCSGLWLCPFVLLYFCAAVLLHWVFGLWPPRPGRYGLGHVTRRGCAMHWLASSGWLPSDRGRMHRRTFHIPSCICICRRPDQGEGICGVTSLAAGGLGYKRAQAASFLVCQSPQDMSWDLCMAVHWLQPDPRPVASMYIVTKDYQWGLVSPLVSGADREGTAGAAPQDKPGPF